MNRASNKKGFGLVEIIIGVGIIATAIIALIASYNVYISYAFANQYNVRAASLLEEGVEAVKYIRDTGWTSNIASLTAGTTYYLAFSGGTWTLSTTPQSYIDSLFNRTLVFATVNRDTNGDIVSSGGSLDTGTKMLTVSVSYRASTGTSTQSVSTYITNIHNN